MKLNSLFRFGATNVVSILKRYICSDSVHYLDRMCDLLNLSRKGNFWCCALEPACLQISSVTFAANNYYVPTITLYVISYIWMIYVNLWAVLSIKYWEKKTFLFQNLLLLLLLLMQLLFCLFYLVLFYLCRD